VTSQLVHYTEGKVLRAEFQNTGGWWGELCGRSGQQNEYFEKKKEYDSLHYNF
jgi:hypothetical protein